MAHILVKVTNTGVADVDEAQAGTSTYFGADSQAHFHTAVGDPTTITEFDVHKSGGSIFTYVPSATLKIEVGYLGSRGVFDVLISS